jgi:hypothetical protein
MPLTLTPTGIYRKARGQVIGLCGVSAERSPAPHKRSQESQRVSWSPYETQMQALHAWVYVMKSSGIMEHIMRLTHRS